MPAIISKKRNTIDIDFKLVKNIPDMLEDNIIYISDEYQLAIHLCMCGCKNQVVTSLGSNHWSYNIKDNKVSLYPSIGNWNFNCRSHYWISNNKILWR